MVDDYANNEEFGKPLNSMIRAYRQGLKDAIGKVVSESAWSEEDEKRLDTICGLLEDIPSHQNWLRTLKDRVQLQQRMTCNEEDKEKLERIINKASYNCGLKNDDISFLKSLKDRYTWKPSNEQLYILNWLATNVLTNGEVEKKGI